MPIVHPATFKVDGRPQVLLRAMQACGALFVKTKQATSFVNSVLETARDALVQEFVSISAVVDGNETDHMTGQEPDRL